MTDTASTFLITGASSGIGLALARAAAGRGDNVVAVARDVAAVEPLVAENGDRVMAIAADVRRQAEIEAAIARAAGAFGRIDIVHNNAGYGVFGAVEESTDEQARAIFDTNVFGLLNVLRATLPVLRAQRAGHILQGSSFYARTAHPGVGLLSGTKYAVEGITDALIGEVEPLGIKVTMIEPGPTATPFGSHFIVADTIADYDRTVREVAKATAELPPESYDDPDGVAAAILAAVDADQPPRRLVTGTFALDAIRTTLQDQLDELEAWRSLSESVAHTPAATT
jgi:NAD(P)-dependent dehydrogenase (short-subunit alcohol dehydrogenase family)